MRKSVVMLAGALDRLGVTDAAMAMRRRGWWPGADLTVVLYHRVADPTEIGDLDAELIDATPEDFDAQMAYLRRHLHPIGLEELLAAHRGGQPLPPGSVLVTFDDGYRDNCEQALPILQRHGMRALFFITTGHLTQRRLFWWERISLLVRQSERPSAQLEYPFAEELDVSTPASKALTVRRLNRLVKDHFALDLERFLHGVSEALGVSWTEAEDRDRSERALMTWDQVRALRAAGMGIGSHTRDHRVLQTLPADLLATELRDSRETLERELGEPVTTIAYPVGRSIAHLPAVRQAVADAGYEIGFTAIAGMASLAPGGDRYDLKRIPIDRGLPDGVARFRIAVPQLAR
jgi:peptidoglycan/xylan/chitin deacetylase (PgdA/CDA1 family)